jgi:hypothetical protein
MYWERDQEITLLHLVLEALDPEEDRGSADMIVSGLIEMALVDADLAPVAQQAWQDEWEGFDVTHEFVSKHYVHPDDEDYVED